MGFSISVYRDSREKALDKGYISHNTSLEKKFFNSIGRDPWNEIGMYYYSIY